MAKVLSARALERKAEFEARAARIESLKLVAGSIIEVCWVDGENQNAIVVTTPKKGALYVEASYCGRGRHEADWLTDEFASDQIVRVVGTLDLDGMKLTKE